MCASLRDVFPVEEFSFLRPQLCIPSSYTRTLREQDRGGLLSPTKMFRFSTSGVRFIAADAEAETPIPKHADVVIQPKIEGAETVFIVPDAPAIPEIGEMILQAPTSSLAELGLNTWWPAGLLRSTFDWIHVTLDVPWWATIVAATLVVRILLFPLVVKSQRNAAVMQRNLPEMQRLQLAMSDARQRGDVMGSAASAHALQEFMKKENFNPIKSMIPALVQAPVFMSFYFGLKKMAEAPVESMKEGGILWFTDLTMPDPIYLLPLLTSTTLFAVIELGAETGGANSAQMASLKIIMRAMPVMTFVFTSGITSFTPAFPAAVLVYWCTSNMTSLVQVGILKIPAVRDFLKIPQKVKHNPDDLPLQKKTMVESWRESTQNSRMAREIDDRARVDSVNFRQAGMGPIPKTYKFDPTKIRPAVSAAPVKK
ncbi:Mitochondrial inner membrane protein OXA1L [Hypsibius exemplaris]|uniref:Mitochondrial inner membrane protein OXA1L n=1 Tax=Hypsibius exemplaris TaxID=2072580 RepID=A0A1W0WQ25_HYPEX|nr:Mitochondrial inner membrane protein OXA1L [Hypsibius exemplaris]